MVAKRLTAGISRGHTINYDFPAVVDGSCHRRNQVPRVECFVPRIPHVEEDLSYSTTVRKGKTGVTAHAMMAQKKNNGVEL